MNPIKMFDETFGLMVALLDLCMYFFLQLIALVTYLISLVVIYIDHHNRKKHIIDLNITLWWFSLGPLIALLLAMMLTNMFLQTDIWDIFIPFIATWFYISLFCIIGFSVKLFYKHKNKPIPMKWYQLGIG